MGDRVNLSGIYTLWPSVEKDISVIRNVFQMSHSVALIFLSHCPFKCAPKRNSVAHHNGSWVEFTASCLSLPVYRWEVKDSPSVRTLSLIVYCWSVTSRHNTGSAIVLSCSLGTSVYQIGVHLQDLLKWRFECILVTNLRNYLGQYFPDKRS